MSVEWRDISDGGGTCYRAGDIGRVGGRVLLVWRWADGWGWALERVNKTGRTQLVTGTCPTLAEAKENAEGLPLFTATAPAMSTPETISPTSRSMARRSSRMLPRQKAAFAAHAETMHRPDWPAEHEAEIEALPRVVWRGRPLRTIVCSQCKQARNMPEAILWSIVSLDGFICRGCTYRSTAGAPSSTKENA